MTQSAPTRRPIWTAGLLAALGAGLVNTLWYLASGALGVPYQVTAPGRTGLQDLPVAVLAVVSIAAVLAGTLALWVLRRWHRGVGVWRVLVVGVYLVSLVSPITGAPAASTMLCLVVAHTVVAAAALLGPGRRG